MRLEYDGSKKSFVAGLLNLIIWVLTSGLLFGLIFNVINYKFLTELNKQLDRTVLISKDATGMDKIVKNGDTLLKLSQVLHTIEHIRTLSVKMNRSQNFRPLGTVQISILTINGTEEKI